MRLGRLRLTSAPHLCTVPPQVPLGRLDQLLMTFGRRSVAGLDKTCFLGLQPLEITFANRYPLFGCPAHTHPSFCRRLTVDTSYLIGDELGSLEGAAQGRGTKMSR